jgi:hypothetical protein
MNKAVERSSWCGRRKPGRAGILAVKRRKGFRGWVADDC